MVALLSLPNVEQTEPQRPPQADSRGADRLTDHVFPHVSHCIELLLTNLTGKFFFCIPMDNLDMFMKGPEFLEGLVTGNTLSRINRKSLHLSNFRRPLCLLADEMDLL